MRWYIKTMMVGGGMFRRLLGFDLPSDGDSSVAGDDRLPDPEYIGGKGSPVEE